MAPPVNRRSGYSRRAQYSTFIGYIAGVLGAITGAVLLVFSIVNPGLFSGLRIGAAEAAEPAGAATASTRSVGRGIYTTLEGYVLAGTRFDAMRRELAEAKVQLVEAQAIKQENRRLRELLSLAERDPAPIAIARITSSTPTSTRRYATIGAGSRDGVTKGMPVRTALGLVGRVLEAGPSSARVLLITDTESLVPVRRAQDDIAGFAQGRGDGMVQIRLIDLGINPLKKGDIFVTSGSGGLYRAGTAMAIVTKVLPDGALASVLANPAAIDFVMVEPSSSIEAVEPLNAGAGANLSR